MGDVGAAGNARGGIPGTMTQQSGADCGVTVASFVRRARAAAWAAVPMRAAPPAIAAAGLGPGPSVVILDFVDTRRLRICDKAAGRRSAPKVPLPHRAKSHPTPPGRPKKVQVRGGMRFCRDRQDRDQYPQVPESRLGGPGGRARDRSTGRNGAQKGSPIAPRMTGRMIRGQGRRCLGGSPWKRGGLAHPTRCSAHGRAPVRSRQPPSVASSQVRGLSARMAFRLSYTVGHPCTAAARLSGLTSSRPS